MAGQLERLVEVSELPNVSLRVMPFRTSLHHGVMSGPFVILWFPLNGDGRETEPPTVYVDGFTGALYLDKPHEVEELLAGKRPKLPMTYLPYVPAQRRSGARATVTINSRSFSRAGIRGWTGGAFNSFHFNLITEWWAVWQTLRVGNSRINLLASFQFIQFVLGRIQFILCY